MPEAGGVREPSGLVLVLTTLPDAAAAETLARTLVEERRIACANLVPGLTSIFRWQGAISREPEVLLLMKTPVERVDQLFRRVSELHPYDVPELLTVRIEAGSAAYCGWVVEETSEVKA